MAEFSQLVKERRSASNFLSDHPITKEELNEMFEWVALAPSAFNLQHTKYVTVLDPGVKEKLKQAANGQYKVFSSSAVLLVLGDKQAYQVLGVLNKQEYDHMVQDTVSFYENKGEQFKRDEAIRNASLSAMMFMLSAKERAGTPAL